MRDGHIHFNKQPYTIEIIEKMVEVAIKNNIDEIYLLDHTHKFIEFSFLYKNLTEKNTLEWYQKKKPIAISEYINFIKKVKKLNWPIKIKFGLEVCYFPEFEEKLRETLNNLPKFDFLVGSIHFINGAAFDLGNDYMKSIDVEKVYRDYFELQKKMVTSKLFDVVGHPDLIRLCDIYPKEGVFEGLCDDFAKFLKLHNQMTENNSGLIRYGYPYPGLSPAMLNSLLKYDVKFHKSSDAHVYEDIGRVFDKIVENN